MGHGQTHMHRETERWTDMRGERQLDRCTCTDGHTQRERGERDGERERWKVERERGLEP